MGQAPSLSGDVLHIRYVPVDVSKKWDRNPKRHDLDAIVASIIRHGFRDAPIYDSTLNAIAAGNGRTTAVAFIRDNPDEVRVICELNNIEWTGNPPAGIAVDSEGVWYLPMQFGVDADSIAAAEAFAVAHNNLTMTGGDFSFLDIASMWDKSAYADLLADLEKVGEMPVGITESDLTDLRQLLDGESYHPPSLTDLEQEYGDPEERDFWPVVRLVVTPEANEMFMSYMRETGIDDEPVAFEKVMRAVDVTTLA